MEIYLLMCFKLGMLCKITFKLDILEITKWKQWEFKEDGYVIIL